MITLDDFGHVTNTVLRRLLAYWLDNRGDCLMASRTDIEPSRQVDVRHFATLRARNVRFWL